MGWCAVGKMKLRLCNNLVSWTMIPRRHRTPVENLWFLPSFHEPCLARCTIKLNDRTQWMNRAIEKALQSHVASLQDAKSPENSNQLVSIRFSTDTFGVVLEAGPEVKSGTDSLFERKSEEAGMREQHE